MITLPYDMGDYVSCNAPFCPPQDFSIDKADIESITQVLQFISNCAVFKLIIPLFIPNRKKNTSLVQRQPRAARFRSRPSPNVPHNPPSFRLQQSALPRTSCVRYVTTESAMSQKHQQIRAAEPTSYPVELNYYGITTLPFIPALNRPPVTEEPSHSAPSTTLSSIQEPISSWWDAPLLMIGTPLPQQSTTLSQQPMTPSRTLPTFTFIDTRTTLWLVLRSLQQRKWPNLKWPASALMPQVTSYGTDVPDNNDCTTSLLCTIENNQQPRYNLYCGWRCVTGFYVSLCCSFRYLRNLFSLFFMT